jgi:L-asparaginase / beta-aspartyl-peptidase
MSICAGMYEFSFAFHGGAGVINRGAIDSSTYYDSLKEVLTKTYSFAAENLNNPGVLAIDVAQYAVELLENDVLYNAGKGSVCNSNGNHEMECSIMDGTTLQSGAASLITRCRNPISVARLVKDHSDHAYLAGEGAENFAALFPHLVSRVEDNSYFATARRREQLVAAQVANIVVNDHDLLHCKDSIQAASDDSSKSGHGGSVNSSDKSTGIGRNSSTKGSESLKEGAGEGDGEGATGTVGCVCYYKSGCAAATSTGGMTNKRPGRVGDTPLIGAGTYANDHTCAVSCTGKGELFLRSVAAYDVSARMAYGGASLTQAVHDVLHAGTVSKGTLLRLTVM